MTSQPDLSNARWYKASASANPGGGCVEVAHLDDGRTAVRDSTNPAGAALVVAPSEWGAFLDGASKGTFNL